MQSQLELAALAYRDLYQDDGRLALDELEQLRSHAAEADALRAERDEIKDEIEAWKDGSLYPSTYREAVETVVKLRKERDELKAKANVSMCVWCGQECEKESGAIAEHVIVCEKRPEHAMLAKFEELLHTVVSQAQTIETARQLISRAKNIYLELVKNGYDYYDDGEDADAWLAAHAPTRGEMEDIGGGCLECRMNLDRDHYCPRCGEYKTVYKDFDRRGDTGNAPKFDSAQEYRAALEKIETVWVGESVADEHIAALKMYTIAARALNNADGETASDLAQRLQDAVDKHADEIARIE